MDQNDARILVVDDRQENLIALEAVLEPLGREVVCVTSGEAALRRLLQEDFAVLLLDVEMPGMDGLETAALVRARVRTEHLPILFVTGNAGDSQRILKGYAQGAVDHLLKPVDPDVVRAKVAFFVELYEKSALIRRQQLELVERRRAEEEARRTSELEQLVMGVVGHDIRSPLSAILATTQVTLRKGGVDDDQRRVLERVERSAQRIRHIVDMLLDVTRARAGGGIPVVRERVCLAGVLRRLVEEAEAAHPNRKLRIYVQSSEDAVWGEWDAARLSQVFGNLLDNALKYGPPQLPITLTLTRRDDAAMVAIHNHGPPIPAGVLATLFEPFRRAQEQDPHARQSLGLGLYIVREIVRAHGGRVDASSNEDGTTFRVSLPLAADVSLRSQAEAQGAAVF